MNPIQDITDKVRTFTLDSLVNAAMKRVSLKPVVLQPWVLLAYFEIVYREADNNKLKFVATDKVFNEICQQLFELMDKHPFANFKEYSPNKLFHVLAYQQFPYITEYDVYDINRQYFLFSAENTNSLLNKKLKTDYKITVSQFLILWKNITTKTSDTDSKNIASLIYNRWTIKHENVKKEIQAFSNGIGNDFYKTFIPEFFIKYPFIEFKGRRHCIDSRLFKRSVYEFLFTFMNSTQDAKSNFDKRFQGYVNKTLEENRITYQPDKELKTKDELECDFFIQDFLLAECKAIELKALAKVNPNDTILKNNLSEIAKAYKQIISTANRIQDKNHELFGVIITYLPFYFSDGTVIWDILQTDIEKFLSEKSYNLLVNPENLFFIDIKTWDKLIDVLKNKGNACLKDIFLKAKQKNTNFKQFDFSIHVNEYK